MVATAKPAPRSAKPRAAAAANDDTLDASGLQHLVGFLLALATAQTRKVYLQSVGVPFDLRPVEFSLLALLLANPGASPKQLGRTLDMPAPNLSVLLDRMAARSLVERQRSRTDGRALQVVLTAEGERLARAAHAASLTMEDPFLEALTPGERLVLRELLLKLARGAAG